MKSTRYWMVLITTAITIALATPVAQTQSPRFAAGQGSGAAAQGPQRFTGAPIDVDYASADLRKVLRQIADIGGINLAIDPSVPVSGAVDLKLTQVPWDQVLDTVMQLNNLTNVNNGPVVIVLTREARTKQLEDEAKQKKAGEKAPDLVTERIRLNFAKAVDIKKMLDDADMLTERGTAQPDERSNILVVKDVPVTVEEIKKLVAELDKPEPQVEIEAYIVQTNQDTARELGVQWGLNAQSSAVIGNTTPLGFPNTASLQGATNNGNAVNMPAVGATSALKLALGSVNGALDLAFTLSALERSGKLEIKSKPKVVTANNKAAEMSSGFQIPYQTVSNNTTTIQYKDAALKLVVTPTISGNGSVSMIVALENATPDFSRSVAGNPSIATQRAMTQVQVPDGTTTAIGGILKTTVSADKESTPGISRVPLIGWMFRHNTNKSESQELVIFLTPRIIR
jgi:type IV pilus assembly protein PilQ